MTDNEIFVRYILTLARTARTSSRGIRDETLRLCWAAVLFAVAGPALAVFNVFATVPEWGALADELGGDKVKVYVTTMRSGSAPCRGQAQA